jgi:hypothetical protein
LKLVGVDIMIELDRAEPYRIGDQISGKVIIATRRKMAFYGAKVHLFWRGKAGQFEYSEDLGSVRLAHQTLLEVDEKKEYDFSFQTPINRSTFVGQQIRAEYSVEARITPIRSRISREPGDEIHIFSRSYMDGVAKINVLPAPFTYRAVPQRLSIKGADLWWLGSAGGWLAATAIGALPAIVVALGALAVTSVIYSNQLYFLQQTPIRVFAGGDNGMRIMLYTTADARVLDGSIFYQIKDLRLDQEEQKQIGRGPLLRVGGRIRDFGRMTTEGFEVILPWITRPLPPPGKIGAAHYRWELVLLPKDKASFSSEKWAIVVRQLEFAEAHRDWGQEP